MKSLEKENKIMKRNYYNKSNNFIKNKMYNYDTIEEHNAAYSEYLWREYGI